MTDKIWAYAGYAVALWLVWKYAGGHISKFVDYTSSLTGSGVGPDIRSQIPYRTPRREYFR
jgi:hypothetical protein